MKKLNTFVYTLILFAAISCKKDIIEQTEGLAALNPTTTDANAGNWKTILLSSGAEIAVPIPIPITAPLYVAELNEIKGLQQNINKDQQKEIDYWAAGGVLRWNEIMRELVAKYNLPPYQNEDGTYPFPQAANPFAYPLFPFSNPPYAARAYAYIAAAQYDALVAAWYYKKMYNRPAPYKNTMGINPMVTPTDLPSYPSEAAVLAGTTAEMMKLLFPTELANIEQKAASHQLSMMRAGAATRSDMLAGEALGRAVAQKFISRARLDKTGTPATIGNPESWAKLTDNAVKYNLTPWVSLESPKRPPMLPGFGNVTPILMPAADLLALRPGPPPLTGSAQLAKETQEVYDFVKNPSRENFRIAHFWADGVGTYSPPGHWNAIAAKDFIAQNLSEVKWSRNMALLNLSMMDAAISCWDTKYFYFNARPCQVNPAIKTFTGTPNFPAYTSGHSTFSAAAATVLGYLIPARADDYNKMANEASLSRIISGIHFRSDCEEGAKVGKKIGEYFVNRGKTDGAL